MSRFAAFGNDLYTGKRSIDFIGRSRLWYAISVVAVSLAKKGLLVRGLNLGIEFTGGSEFRVSNVTVTSAYEGTAQDAVHKVAAGAEAKVTKLGSTTVRVQTEKLDDTASNNVRDSLAKAFHTSDANVSANFIGPSWGESVSKQALKALLVFLGLVGLVMAAYFRTWKMAVSALVALIHDLIFTVGIYALTGVEVSPATMIGFLTVLGYSLYDTVVVFDKVRENTTEALANRRMSYAAAANLAVNQTLVRSINTTVVALLPIAAVLVLAFTRLGPGTLLDLTLALFLGMAVGAYSSIFIASPLLVTLRSREPDIVKLAKQATRHDEKSARRDARSAAPQDGPPAGRVVTPSPVTPSAATASAIRTHSATESQDAAYADLPPEGDRGTLTGRKVHKYAQQGPRNQPRKQPKSKR